MVGSQPEVWRLLPDGRQVTRRCWRGPAERTDTDREEAKEEKREDTGKLHGVRNPGKYWRGERGGGAEPSLDGENSKLNLEGQSLDTHQDAVWGLE